ncbi:MAG: class I SAM-dependent methyltransferase [Clostridiaceae bacterium]|jgi:2-polyprenyl-3-methyl-5-hydroxy-6-metoxy-1,4-benzoquinol methylase|nr:class I SAM-dependent methyltransferase [Herbinix sp.]NLM19519.1 class I SAM-dependent methyltransferase [Clostridiaceae bacterium]
MNCTIDYYNKNANQFIDNTSKVDFESHQNLFLKKLSEGAYILDFGCGSGRDTKAFLDKGYAVIAVDGSKELCILASQYTGIDVKQMMFQELNECEVYDGIWACASILHLSKDELLIVIAKMCEALKQDGIIYMSFKYGEFEGYRKGRYFIDMTEATFEKLIVSVTELVLEDQWISHDVRHERKSERWLNMILRKRKI